MYSAGNEGQKICGDLPETTAFKSYAAKQERKTSHRYVFMGMELMNRMFHSKCEFKK